MIDHRHQGNGHGARALERIFRDAVARRFSGLSLTVMDSEPSNALVFYRKHGFTPTGRRIDGEVELVRRAPRYLHPFPSPST